MKKNTKTWNYQTTCIVVIVINFDYIKWGFSWDWIIVGAGNSLYMGRLWYHMCSCQPTVGLTVLSLYTFCFHCTNSLFYSWLTTACSVATLPFSSLVGGSCLLYKNTLMVASNSIEWNVCYSRHALNNRLFDDRTVWTIWICLFRSPTVVDIEW